MNKREYGTVVKPVVVEQWWCCRFSLLGSDCDSSGGGGVSFLLGSTATPYGSTRQWCVGSLLLMAVAVWLSKSEEEEARRVRSWEAESFSFNRLWFCDWVGAKRNHKTVMWVESVNERCSLSLTFPLCTGPPMWVANTNKERILWQPLNILFPLVVWQLTKVRLGFGLWEWNSWLSVV